jgi:cytidylate kinase
MNKNEKFVITINRELGSGGRTVGRKLAERLSVKYYDKALIEGLTQKFGLSVEEIERIKAQKKTWWNEFNNYYNNIVGSASQPMESEVRVTTASMFDTERRILQELAAKESCVVAGRSGFMVFRHWPNHLNILILASMENRIARVMKKKGVSEAEAREIIEKVDADRETFIKKYEDTSRYDARNYQLVISMDDLSEDDAVEVIISLIERMSQQNA